MKSPTIDRQSDDVAFLSSSYRRYVLTRKMFFFVNHGVNILQSICLGTFVYGIWHYYSSLHWNQGVLLFLLSFAVSYSFFWPSFGKSLEFNAFLRLLEVKYADTSTPVWNPGIENSSPLLHEWKSNIEKLISEVKEQERMRLFRSSASFCVAMLLALTVIGSARAAFVRDISGIASFFSSIHSGVDLRVLQGDTESNRHAAHIHRLTSSKTISLDIVKPNLLEISLFSAENKPIPVIYLNHEVLSDNEIVQSFRMHRIKQRKKDSSLLHNHQISFAISSNVSLTIPSLFGDHILAKINVNQLPVPTVKLRALEKVLDPWHDEVPLSLKIEVASKAPLDEVYLVIRSGNHEVKELVNRINSQDIYEYSRDYKLTLEPYVNKDLANVEIVALATDRSLPQPLSGRSSTLSFQTASAYGRYRNSLKLLSQGKTLLDGMIESGKTNEFNEAKKIFANAENKSTETPFFDTLDRIEIKSFAEFFSSTEKFYPDLYTLQAELDNFLVEHEILDDRERDRDFFVGSRALSRLLEQSSRDRPVEVAVALNNLISFLNSRRNRWDYRVSQLKDENVIRTWKKNKTQKPYIKSLKKIGAYAKKDTIESIQSSQKILSQLSSNYRNWIELLEAKEDQQRESREKKRQEGLASARQELRNLQKRQGKVSKNLDQATSKEKVNLKEQWAITRLKQNRNIKQTRKLGAQMRSLSPKAGGRIQAALSAMEMTVELGNNENFVKAESFSDLAGRLLRRAEQDSVRDQKRSSRRRRKVSGDQYYGQSIHGADLEISREYEVDKRYRDDVLNEIRGSKHNETNQTLLENYLRKIVR